jgi:hypothetical protein
MKNTSIYSFCALLSTININAQWYNSSKIKETVRPVTEKRNTTDEIK